MLGGACTSVAANVAHVYVTPRGAVHGWTPEPGAVLAAIVWPLALLGASEVLARKRWAHRWTRVLGTVSVLVVAIVAAVISYQHLHDLLFHYGESQLSATIGPLGIDGLMLVCSVALVAADTPVHTPCTPVVHAPEHVSDTVPSTPVHVPERAPDTAPGVPVHVPSAVHTPVHVPVAAASTPRPDTVTCTVEDEPPALGLVDVLVLQGADVHTLRGAMDTLKCGQARARRALEQAWPDVHAGGTS
jgi:hypothetical protein